MLNTNAKTAKNPGRETPVDERIVDRKPSRGSVLVQSSRGDSCVAKLRDISTYGCNLQTEADWLRAGNYISIRLGADRIIQAIVRWVRDSVMGVEFLRPISDAEADKLATLTH